MQSPDEDGTTTPKAEGCIGSCWESHRGGVMMSVSGDVSW